MLYLFVWKWQVAVSNSSRVDLHKNPIGKVGFLIFFQTPAEEIYTLSVISLYFEKSVFKLQRRKFTLILCVFIGGAALFSNSSGGNLHPIRDYHFCAASDVFKLQRRKFTHTITILTEEKQVFSNSSGGNLHDYRPEETAVKENEFSNSSGGNLHVSLSSVRIQTPSFQTPAEEIYTKAGTPNKDYVLAPFQTPAEEIYTIRPDRQKSPYFFKLQRRKFTQHQKFYFSKL